MLYKATFIGVSRKVNQIVATLLTVLLIAGPIMAETATDYGPITKSPTGQIKPGQFVWADLLTHDVPTAVNFYTNVFGWEVEYKDDKNYAHASIDGEPVAAIAAYNEGEDENAEGVWLMSVSVHDIRNAGQAVKAAGGKVLEGPEDLPGRGQYILVEDPRGALIMLLRANDGKS